MLQNRLKLLMVKKHKTIKQVSQETGIKKGSLEMYVLGRDIIGDDLTILARYFETNIPYLCGIWDLIADEKHFSHFRKLFRDKSYYYIPDTSDIFEDLDNCFYNFWIQAIENTVLENNFKAEKFFKALMFKEKDDCVFITISDKDVIKSLECYNSIIRYHYPEGGEYTPILSFKGNTIE
ncbi:helix-turn-helix transcriptional regulator [uncultured Streptococcus sp.]|uniref:helix-turn-helix domain-containing protein n=1 Tax=uncultured Streptococcus sp. TaxID=83427 RepID=UPI0028D13DDE|nr:helix-turn-helix transcriptional regulator [uncultured Streptococcus sp.]